MKMAMIAALVAAQLSAAGPAEAAELRSEELATQQRASSMDDADLAGDSRTLVAEGDQINLAEGQASALRLAAATASPRRAAAQEDEPKKRKSTGDKVLTGAAVILGIGAVAVAGLLVAVFVN